MKHPVPERMPSAREVYGRLLHGLPGRTSYGPLAPAHRRTPPRPHLLADPLFQALVSGGAQTRRLVCRAERTSSAYLKPRRVP